MPIALTTRLENVVGYSSKDCTCVDTDRPASYATSHSGYYSDEGEHGISTLIPQETCGDGSIWDLLTRARTDAINDFITHFSRLMALNENKIINNKSISIGKSSGTAYKTSLTNKGYLVEPCIYKGLFWVVDNAKIQIDAAESVDLKFVSSEGVTTTKTQTTVANEWTQFIDAPIRLPLSSKNQSISYEIYYTSVGNHLNNTVYCGNCSSKKVDYKDLFLVSSIQSDTTDFANHGNNGNGLLLSGRLECDGLEWLNDVEDDFFSRNQYGRMIAKCLQLFWSIKIAEEILSQDTISVNTQLSREHLYGKRNKFQKLVNDMMMILTSEIPEALNHCYQCSDSYGMENQSL